jgi:KaiC/GvpD/RAD55 family RecA-like ATPase
VFGDVWDVQARNEGKDVVELLKTVSSETRTQLHRPSPSKVFATVDDLKSACPGTVEDVYTYTNPQTQQLEMIVIRSQTAEGKTFRQARPCSGGFEMKAPEKPWPLYNRGRIVNSDTVVVVEGEKCVHALYSCGVIATTSPAGAGKAEYADWNILAGKNVILWPDNDLTGKRHMMQVEAILQKLEPAVRISAIEPADLDLEESEDAADYIEQIKTVGIDVGNELNRVIQQAKPKGIAARVSERIEEIIEGKLEAVPLPWTNLSYFTNAIIPGTVTLICGSPGASKSFMLLQALCYWLDKGVKACVYELEEDREFHLMRALAQRSGNASVTRMDWIKANPQEARQILIDNKDFIDAMGRNMWACPDSQLTLDQLAKWSEDRANAGHKVICIDPITAAVQTAKPWIEDSAFLQRIKRTATDSGCSFVLVTHPSKTMGQPDMSAMAGSAAYSRFAQSILWLHSHQHKNSKIKTDCGTTEEGHNRTVHILKARNGKGHGMSIACEFNSEQLTLKELGLIIKKKSNVNIEG